MEYREENDLISCHECDKLLDDDEEAIEEHSCIGPYYTCMTCAGD